MALFGLYKRSTNPNAMSFWGHIDALRGHLFRSAVVVLILAVAAFFEPEFLFDKVIFGPLKSDFITYRAFRHLGIWLHNHWPDWLSKISKFLSAPDANALDFGHYTFKLQSLGLADQFTSQMWIAIVAGLIVGAPYVLWEIWRFIKPALKDKEKKASTAFILSATFLFLSGVLFAYYIIVPLMVNFLGNYQISTMIENNFTFDSYISTVTTLTLSAGLIFELPILVFFLTKFGIMTPQFMRKYRRHAIVVIMIVAGVITPSPDITSQLLVAFPLYFLYEASIFVSYYVIKRKAKTE